MTYAIETTELTRVFGRREAVSGLSLRVPAGTVFALIGPNGAGKTTTMRLLMNLVRPTRGAATVLGVDARELGPKHYARIGYVSENQQLPDWMTLPQLVDYCRPLYPTWDDDLRRALHAELGLNASEPLGRMSRGTRMKAALLVSLAYRPELLVLDEPFTGLDPLVREELVRGLLEVPDDRRPWTVLLSSHDVDEVERLADWIGFMSEGRLLFAEPVASLLARFRRVEVVAEGEPDCPAGQEVDATGGARGRDAPDHQLDRNRAVRPIGPARVPVGQGARQARGRALFSHRRPVMIVERDGRCGDRAPAVVTGRPAPRRYSIDHTTTATAQPLSASSVK